MRCITKGQHYMHLILNRHHLQTGVSKQQTWMQNPWVAGIPCMILHLNCMISRLHCMIPGLFMRANFSGQREGKAKKKTQYFAIACVPAPPHHLVFFLRGRGGGVREVTKLVLSIRKNYFWGVYHQFLWHRTGSKLLHGGLLRFFLVAFALRRNS